MSSAPRQQALNRTALCLPGLAHRAVIAAFFWALLSVMPEAQAQPRDLFTIRNIAIEANGESSTAARTAALAEGQRRAWRLLVARLVLRGDAERSPRTDEAFLSNVVQGVELADERTSTTRYLARLTVQFRPERVRAALREANLHYSETSSKPVLLLPVLETGAGKFLMEGPPHWRDALRATERDGLLPMVVPPGDDADALNLSADAVMGPNATRALAPLFARLKVTDALVAHAIVLPAGEDNTQLAINFIRIGNAGPRELPEGLAFPLSGDGAESVRNAARETIARLEETWKRETQILFDRAGELSVTVPLKDLGQWVSVRNRLSEVPTLRQAELMSLTSRDAQVKLQYFGEAEQLALALAQKDIDLRRSADGFWTLVVRR